MLSVHRLIEGKVSTKGRLALLISLDFSVVGREFDSYPGQILIIVSHRPGVHPCEIDVRKTPL